MPHIEVKLLKGKNQEQKETLCAALIEAAQSIIGYGDESYSVSIEDFSLNDWKNTIYPNDIIGKKGVLFKQPGYKM